MYSRDCITSVSPSLFYIALSLHTHHTDWYFLWYGIWLFSPLTDGCRSTVGGTNVWKLLSDEYGDYNVTRDLHIFSLWDFLLVDGWLMFDGLRYIHFFDVTSNARNSLVKWTMTLETTAKSESLVRDQ